MSNFVGVGAVPTKTRRVFLRSGTANEGYAVNFNFDAVGVTVENDSISINTAITDWSDARRGMVDVPDAANNMHFAGVVDKSSDGIVGPNWITIHEPGSICNIYVDSVVSVGAGDTPPQNTPALLTYTIGMHSAASFTTLNGVFKFAGLPGAGSAWALEETSTTPQLVMAELQTGPPSGGVQAVGSNATISTLSVNSDLPLIGHGRVMTSTCDIDSTAVSLAISIPRSTLNHWVGQRLMFDAGGFANTTAVANILAFSSCVKADISAEAGEPYVTAVTSAICSAARYFDFTWNGKAWLLTSSNSTAVHT